MIYPTFSISKVLLSLALGALLAACGGDDNSDNSGSGSSSGGASSSGGGASSSSSGGNDGAPVSGLDSRPSNTTCLAGPPITQVGDVATAEAFPNLPQLQSPVALLQAPGNSDEWFVVEQAGRIFRFENDVDADTLHPFADLRDNVGGPVRDGGERGLLGMAFHPDYVNNRTVFLSYTAHAGVQGDDSRSVLARFTVSADGTTLDAASETEVFTVGQPFGNHNGGQIAFGPDGYLYFGLGDGGSGGDPINAGQDISTPLGAMLRIDVDSGAPYAIPPDNPFAGSQCESGGCPEIYAWGFRNPWRWSFDTATGELWMGDVGQGEWEEVNRVERGENYGWRCYEGSHPFNTNGCGPSQHYTPPLTEYNHNGGHCSVTGGYVYRGAQLPQLTERYLYADYCSGQIWSTPVARAFPAPSEPLLDTPFNIAAFGQGRDGEVYILDLGGGRIYRFIDSGNNTSTIGGPPRLLSDTGCVDQNNPQAAAAGLIPYSLNVPFWSDGADKSRWLALPDNATISIDSSGDWVFPIGSVLMKHFRLNGQMVEVRLMMRHDNGEWAGYSYEWDTQENNATLLDVGKEIQAPGQGQLWHYPSRNECLQCHTAAAKRTLGPQTAQLNREQFWPTTGRTANILATADTIDLLTAPLGGLPENHPALPDVNDVSTPIEARARAWLHSNCAQCHRSGANLDIDLQFDTSLPATKICDVPPSGGDLGITDARIVAPGDAARSVLVSRINRRDGQAMPPVGSKLIDTEAVQLLSDWINGLQSCN